MATKKEDSENWLPTAALAYSRYGILGSTISRPRVSSFPIRAPDELSIQPEFQSQVSQAELRRNRLLLNLVSEEDLESRYHDLFVSAKRGTRRFVFIASGAQPMSEYVRLFSAVDTIYRLIISLQVSKYFTQHWLKDEELSLSFSHELKIITFRRASPDEAHLSGIGAGLKALAEVLNIGKQIQEFKMTDVRVAEARLALRIKELENQEAERNAILKSNSAKLSEQLALETLRAQIRAVQLKAEHEEIDLKSKRLKLLDDAYLTLAKHAPVVSTMPAELKEETSRQLLEGIKSLEVSSFTYAPTPIKSLEEDEAGPDTPF